MANNCFIYGLRDKDLSDYFYVGSTKRSPSIRFRQHLGSARRRQTINKHLEAKILKVGVDSVVLDVLEETPSEGRSVCEYSWITKLRAQGCSLTNIQLSEEEARARCQKESDWQRYLDSILTPEHVLWQLGKLEEPVIAVNPRFQPLAIKLHDAAVLIFRTLVSIDRNEWFKLLGVDPECELSDTIRTRIKALPLLC